MPTALTPLEAMSVHVQKATLEMEYRVKVSYHFFRFCLLILFLNNIDINECLSAEEYPCHSKANCSNTPGSFYCTCLSGFSGDGRTCEGTNYLIISAHLKVCVL